MSAAAWALQEAVYSALVGDGALTALVGGRVFDRVPRGSAFPYIVIGEAREEDTVPPTVEHTLTLHLWSRGGGFREIKEIAGAVRTALEGAALSLTGHVLVSLAFLSADYVRQSDGETWRGTARFRAVTEPQ